MPRMTGTDLAAALMAIRPDLPVVLLTGYSDRVTEAGAAAMGIRAFAYKPLVKTELAATVRRVLDGAGMKAAG